jgi:L-lysine exporter family protein LysE/ArgO
VLSPAFAAGLSAGASLIIAIGAQNLFVLRQGLQQRHVGLVVSLCVLADAGLIVLGVAGLGLAVQHHAGWLPWLRYAGAAFLSGYGGLALWRAWRGEAGLKATATGIEQGWRRVALTCLGFTLLNPHVYLDTVILLGSLSTRFAGSGRWWFAAGAATASLLWFVALGYGARVLLPVFRSPLAWRWLDGLVALLMFGLALFLLLRPVA